MHAVMLKLALIILAGALLYAAIVIFRGLLRLRGSDAWPVTEGTITSVKVERVGTPSSGTMEYQANIEYQFSDASSQRRKGQWRSQSFAKEEEAREFIRQEMPFGKVVAVKYNGKDPKTNYLELDSWTYSDDRPLNLDI